jgi:hypothetical protein
MAKKKKYLIDTSAVRPALGFSTSRHCDHFPQETKDGSLWSSVYIRMEFIRVWFCEFARIAFTIEHFDNVEEAMYYLEQEFSQRQNKSDIAGIGSFVNEMGPLRNCRAASEEFASLAMRWLKTFDFVFPARIRNSCRCQIGGKTPNIDYNHFLADLHQFYEVFQTPVVDCEIKTALGLQKPMGRAASLINDPKAATLNVVTTLERQRRDKSEVTCVECARIGDAVIALEQPGAWMLIHTDKSFDDLCRVLGKDHKKILSLRAIHRNLRETLNPKKAT